jgi:transcriptional regulator with XRE-family HTH domain
MAADRLSISTFAKRTKTGRNSVRRILDGKNTSITLKTMARAAEALNLELTLSVKELSPVELGKIADCYASANDEHEAAKLEDQFVEGFYSKLLMKAHAKDSAV